ncbi:hypothetical protein RF11_06260 [Thelohanellus kitauei]|uniref:Uncharacterized protein n=1 Tax=Thelohanellus kitauei TaxID=669202 RepID=A0A0C2M8M2_THEKT|nr:hypothetical protein RF11_06260 [Thelohanellus kitauei]
MNRVMQNLQQKQCCSKTENVCHPNYHSLCQLNSNLLDEIWFQRDAISKHRFDLREINSQIKNIRNRFVQNNAKLFDCCEDMPSRVRYLNSIHLLSNLSKIYLIELPYPIHFRNTMTVIEDKITSKNKKFIEVAFRGDIINCDLSILPYLEVDLSQVNKIMGIENSQISFWNSSERNPRPPSHMFVKPQVSKKHDQLDTDLKSKSINEKYDETLFDRIDFKNILSLSISEILQLAQKP